MSGLGVVVPDAALTGTVFVFPFIFLHEVGVGLAIPPYRADISVKRAVALMIVAGKALHGGNHLGQLVLDREPGFSVNRGIGADADGLVAELRVLAGSFIARIRVDDVAGAATAATEVAADLVYAQKPQSGIVQARLENVQVDGGDASTGSRAAITEFVIVDFGDAEWVRNFCGFKLRMRVKLWHGTAILGFARGRGIRKEGSRLALGVVTFSVYGDFRGERAVVVEDGAVSHGVGGHDGVADRFHDIAVTIAATLIRNAQVRGIQEANELRTFEVQVRIGVSGPFAIREDASLSRQDVGGFFRSGRVIAAVAVDASDVALVGVHRFDSDVASFALALVRRFGIGGFLVIRLLVVRLSFLRANSNRTRANDQGERDEKG